jgi:hypothetical protein
MAANANVLATGVPRNYNLRNFENFYNEIAFIGRFWSQNCVGCALTNPPKKGDGSLAQNAEEAQLYDFNYFRFSSLAVQTTVKEDGRTYFVGCNGQATNIRYSVAQVNNNLCWTPRAGATNSAFMQARRAALGSAFKDADRRSVNFIFESPENLPIFSDL